MKENIENKLDPYNEEDWKEEKVVELDAEKMASDCTSIVLNDRKVICQYKIGTDKIIKEYDSSHDVERETGIIRNHVCKCCKGIENFNTAGGYYWRFKDNYFPLKNKKKI